MWLVSIQSMKASDEGVNHFNQNGYHSYKTGVWHLAKSGLRTECFHLEVLSTQLSEDCKIFHVVWEFLISLLMWEAITFKKKIRLCSIVYSVSFTWQCCFNPMGRMTLILLISWNITASQCTVMHGVKQ